MLLIEYQVGHRRGEDKPKCSRCIQMQNSMMGGILYLSRSTLHPTLGISGKIGISQYLFNRDVSDSTSARTEYSNTRTAIERSTPISFR